MCDLVFDAGFKHRDTQEPEFDERSSEILLTKNIKVILCLYFFLNNTKNYIQ